MAAPGRTAKTLQDVDQTNFLDFTDWETNGSGISFLSQGEMPCNVVDRFRAQAFKVLGTNPVKTQGKLIIKYFCSQSDYI